MDLRPQRVGDHSRRLGVTTSRDPQPSTTGHTRGRCSSGMVNTMTPRPPRCILAGNRQQRQWRGRTLPAYRSDLEDRRQVIDQSRSFKNTPGGQGQLQGLGFQRERLPFSVPSLNLLDDIRNSTAVRYVMRGGKLSDGETLDEIAPVAKPLPKPWWRDSAPPKP